MAVEIKVPNVGESVTEVTIASWLKEDGDFVEMDEPVCEVESDKASFEIAAEDEGKLQIKVKEGEEAGIDQVIATIDTEAERPAGEETKNKKEEEAPANQEKTPEKEAGKEESYAIAHPSPAAEKILKEKGISLQEVNGSGKGGRITKEDALKAAESAGKKKTEEKETPAKPQKEEEEVAAPPGTELKEKSRETARKKMSSLRKTVANRLVEVKNQTAMLTTFNEIDMTNVMALRKKYKEIFKEKHEVNLGFMSFFAKACTEAIQSFPDINAMIDGEEIVYHHYVDLGIAVSTDRGLVVPNIRNAESMSLADLERSVLYFAQKARNNKIKIEEMQGGTFSITNGGLFGSMLSTPILNGPQSAILGMHRIVERPVAIDGNVEVRPVMYVALSYDHRVVDGKESVSFLYRVKELLEDPVRLLINV